jgi:hypothetical protein
METDALRVSYHTSFLADLHAAAIILPQGARSRVFRRVLGGDALDRLAISSGFVRRKRLVTGSSARGELLEVAAALEIATLAGDAQPQAPLAATHHRPILRPAYWPLALPRSRTRTRAIRSGLGPNREREQGSGTFLKVQPRRLRLGTKEHLAKTARS